MKRLLVTFLALYSAFAFSATLNPVQLLNPAGSASGQAIVSTGPTTAPVWGNISPSSISYTQGSTGSVARSLPSKLGDVISVADFGANNTCGASATAAVQAAINAAATATNGAVYVPPGCYLVAGLTWSGNGYLKLYGAGPSSRLQLNGTSGSILSTTAGTVDVEGFTVLHPTAGAVTSGYFFQFTGTQASLRNIVFFNGYSLALWGQGCSNGVASNITATGMSRDGFGVDVSFSTAGQQYGIISFDLLRFQGTSINTGTGLNLVSGDTVTVSNSNIAGFSYNITGITNASHSYLANLFFTNVLADGAGGPAASNVGWFFDGTNQFLARIYIANSWASAMGSAGMYFKNVKTASLVANEVIQNGVNGIIIETGSRDIRLIGNVVSGNSTTTPGVGNGVSVFAGANNIHLYFNKIGPTLNTNTTGGILNTQGYGLIINSSTITNYSIIGNDLTGNTVAGLNDLGGGTAGTTKNVAQNITGTYIP